MLGLTMNSIKTHEEHILNPDSKHLNITLTNELELDFSSLRTYTKG